MEFDDEVKLAVYRHFGDTGERPGVRMLASHLGADTAAIAAAFERRGPSRR